MTAVCHLSGAERLSQASQFLAVLYVSVFILVIKQIQKNVLKEA